MYRVEEFSLGHLFELLKEPGNRHVEEWFRTGLADRLKEEKAFTLLLNEDVLVCGGISAIWENRGILWCVFSDRSKNNFVPVYRKISKWLNNQLLNNFARIELSVDHGEHFEMAKRRAEMLGFKLEVERARRFLPTGGDCALYSMVRED